MVICGEKWVSAMFMGEFNHSVDAKGRVIIPSKFRELLGEEFVITKGFDNCISIYDKKNWEDLQSKLASMPMISKDARLLRRMIVGGASLVETDKQGRILLPASLRTYANIDKEAVLVGNIEHIEIWSKEAWESELDIDTDIAAEKLYNSGITL